MELLPDEMLIQTISHLKVADVQSCRLVCRRWYSCCESRTVTRSEIFEFRSSMYLASEISEFLINLKRNRVNVRLIKTDLKELNFEKFGRKIDELELIECSTDVDTLRKLFHLTPNMTRLRAELIFPDKDSAKINDYHTWTTIINLLHEHKFQNPNLKQFECDNLESKKSMDKDPGQNFILPHVFFIFPCLQNISLWSTIKVIDDPELWSSLPKTNITHFGGTFKINFDVQQDQLETIASSFSRLKTLHLRISLSAKNRSSLSSCDRFFSHLTELEDLTLECALNFNESFMNRPRLRPCELHELAMDTSKVVKAVSFQILKSSLKLNKFKLMYNYPLLEALMNNCKRSVSEKIMSTKIVLDPEEVQEFSSLITKIKSLRFYGIFIKLDSKEPTVTLPNADGVLKDLEFEANFCGPSDVHYIIMKTYQLTTLDLRITRISSVINFGTILQSQKCLQRLKIHIRVPGSEIGVLQMKLNEFCQWKHERLNHLDYRFETFWNVRGQIGGRFWESQQERCYLNPINYFIIILCSWDFPNLRTLQVNSETIGCYPASEDWSDLFKKWMGRMTRLTEIDVAVSLHSDRQSFEDCAQVLHQMPHLQVVHWSSHKLGTRMPTLEEVIDLFDNLPNLRLISFGKRCEWYKYIRSKKQLFQRWIVRKFPEEYDFILLHSL